jgi:hypothetical protein
MMMQAPLLLSGMQLPPMWQLQQAQTTPQQRLQPQQQAPLAALLQPMVNQVHV